MENGDEERPVGLGGKCFPPGNSIFRAYIQGESLHRGPGRGGGSSDPPWICFLHPTIPPTCPLYTTTLLKESRFFRHYGDIVSIQFSQKEYVFCNVSLARKEDAEREEMRQSEISGCKKRIKP
ncbi:hypothetical protein LguiA_020681 [Lonicera macranthoides]